MALRWGFKTEANRLANELRTEIGVGIKSPLDPWKLARHLAIPILTLSSMKAEAKAAVAHFMRRDQKAFSAATIFRGSKRIVVLNDAHHVHRQASSLAHETGHIVLWHEPECAITDAGVRVWNPDQEREAEFIGGALLVSEDAALEIARLRQPLSTAAEAFGVSLEMMTYRIGITGAYKRVARAARYASGHRRSVNR